MISDFSQWKHCCCSTYFSSFLPAASQKEFGWIPIIFYMKLSPLHFKKEISKIFHISNVNKQQFFLPRQWELTLVPAFPVGWSKAPATLQFRFFCVDIIFLGTFLYYVMHFLPCRCSPICLPDTNVSFVKTFKWFFVKTISTLKICGDSSCCLSRSLDNDSINWIPGQTDVFTGPEWESEY